MPVKDFYPFKWCPDYVKRRRKKAEDKGFRSDLCQQQSSYEIDGRCYCTKHAGQMALEILVKGDGK